MPYKYFTPQQLTSNEVNTFLMNQSVMVFESEADRNTNLTAPTEGMVCYLKDSDRLLVYQGSQWLPAVILDTANRYAFPGSITVITEASAGRGIGVRASAGDTTPPTVQFTNNAVTTQLATITAPSAGNLSLNADRVQRNGSSFVNIVDVPLEVNEWNMAGSSGSRTLSTNIPTNARYIYADVFTTNITSDHYNIEFSDTSCATGIKNWVDSRGQQPSTQFGNMLSRRSVYLTHPGEVDGYTPNYGIWFSGILIPVSGRTMFWGSFGSNGQAWIYVKVMGFST